MCVCVSIDGLVKACNLKKRMEKLNEVVSGLKEGKQEMSKHMQELDSSINAHILKIKVCIRERHKSCPAHTPVPHLSYKSCR